MRASVDLLLLSGQNEKGVAPKPAGAEKGVAPKPGGNGNAYNAPAAPAPAAPAPAPAAPQFDTTGLLSGAAILGGAALLAAP